MDNNYNYNNNYNTGQMPYQQAVYRPRKRVYKPLDKKDNVFMFLFFAAAFLIVDFALTKGMHLGFTLSYIFAFIISTLYLFEKENKPSVFSLLCGGISVAGSITFAISSNYLVNSIMFVLISGLFAIYTLGISGSFTKKEGNYKMLIDMFSAAFINPFESMGEVFGSIKAGASRGKKSMSAFFGALVALPVLFIVIPLLVKSDAAFEGLITAIAKNIGIYLLEMIAAAILLIYIYPFMFGKKRSKKDGSNITGKTKSGVVPVSGCVSFLSVISATYLVYLFSQLAYFFSAFGGILPKGYQYSASDFARRGFYEMFAVCAINIAIISLVNIFSKKKALVIKCLSLFISLFSVLLIIVAMQKMNLNIKTYGLSRNRIMVCTFMVMMIVIIAFFILHIFAPKISYMQPIIIICSVIFVAMSFANINAITVRYNVEALSSGKIQNINYINCYYVGDYSLEYLAGITKLQNPERVAKAEVSIAKRFWENEKISFSEKDGKLKVTKNDDFRSYCRDKETALDTAINYYNSLDESGKKHFAKIYSYAKDYSYSYKENCFIDYSNEKVYSFNKETGEFDKVSNYDENYDYQEYYEYDYC